jgi:hypothetical protein
MISKYNKFLKEKQMRDILNLLDSVLTEASLGADQIPATSLSKVADPKTGKLLTRPELFLFKVKTGSPFTLKDGSGDVVIDPTEANKVAAWIKSSPKGPAGSIPLRTADGGTVKNTELLKTIEFGSKESETIKLKGSDIFDVTDQEVQDFGNSIESLLASGGFPASEMYNKIASSPQVKKLGKLGDAVIFMARQASEGQIPEFPKNLSEAEIKAIELYASEYIGVLGLLSGITKFKKGNRKDFDEFVGTSLNDMIMYFPKDTANPLADSFSVVNDETGHAIKISSKAAGKGAPPAMGSLKIPEDVQKKYPDAYEFFITSTTPGQSAFVQPFAMMNWLSANAPKTVPAEYRSLLPFTDELIVTLENSLKNSKPLPAKLMKIFNSRLSSKVQNSANTDGGKAWYAVTKDVMNAVNNENAVEDFQPMVIQSLGYNFIQLYTNVKGNKLVTEAFWPAKISGQVKLKTKASASNPTKGKISVEISPDGRDEEPEIGTGDVPAKKTKTKNSTADLDAVTQKRSGVTARAGGVEKKLGSEKTLGRKRQR